MKLGSDVPGLFTEGVFFVEDDLYDVNKRVIEYDADARLVVNKLEDHHLGIARYVKDQKWAPGGVWMVAFWMYDQDTGKAITGEPTAQVINYMKQFDTRCPRASEKEKHRVRKALQMRAYRDALRVREGAGELAEFSVHQWKQKRGKTNKIYVPSGTQL